MTRRMTDATFHANQLAGIRDPRVSTVNRFCDELMAEIPESRVPYIAPHYNASNASILSLLSNPGPRASGANGSGFVSRENDDPSAERMGRVWDMAGLSDEDAFPWNAYPWHVHETYPNGLPDDLVDVGLGALRQLLELHPKVTAIVAHGGDAHRSTRRFLEDPEHRAFARARGLEVWETRHTSNRAFIMTQEKRLVAEEAMADLYRQAMAHAGLSELSEPNEANEDTLASHPSDSAVQRAAGAEMLDALSAELGINLAPASIVLSDGTKVQVNGTDADRTTLVEAYARETALKPGNTRKIAHDALKLLWLGNEIGATRLIIALSSEEAAHTLLHGRGWMRAAFADLGIEVKVVSVSEETHLALLNAQQTQVR